MREVLSYRGIDIHKSMIGRRRKWRDFMVGLARSSGST